MAQVSVIH